MLVNTIQLTSLRLFVFTAGEKLHDSRPHEITAVTKSKLGNQQPLQKADMCSASLEEH